MTAYRTAVLQRAESILRSAWLTGFILLAGAALRIIQYLHNRSLWFDEASLALNIVHRDFAQLLQPLDYQQAAPTGFLLLQRLAVELFGPGEYALRLVPLLAGIAALFVFYAAARRALGPRAVPLAVALFALSDQVIFYAAEAKQYSLDVLVALVIIVSGLHLLKRELTAPRLVAFTALGAALLWFSHPAVLVLAGVGSALLLDAALSRRWRRVVYLAAAAGCWLASFGGFYAANMRAIDDNSFLAEFWQEGFMPLPPTSLDDLRWLTAQFFKLFSDVLKFSLPGLAAFACLAGGLILALRERSALLVLTLPVVFALLASGLERYPFHSRLILFLAPGLLLLVAEGAEQVRRAIAASRPEYRRAMPIIGALLVVLLVYHPVAHAITHLRTPRAPLVPPLFGLEDIRPVVQHVAANRQPGDFIYLYYGAERQMLYYGPQYGLERDAYVISPRGREDWPVLVEDMERALRGQRRAWVIFSHVWKLHGIDEHAFMLACLDQMGAQANAISADGAWAYLYILDAPADRAAQPRGPLLPAS